MEPTKITAERARTILHNRDWQWVEGFWRPTLATVEDNPAVTPGNYTMEEALKLYGYELEKTDLKPSKPTIGEFFEKNNLTAEDFMKMSPEDQQKIRTEFATEWGLPVHIMFGIEIEEED